MCCHICVIAAHQGQRKAAPFATDVDDGLALPKEHTIGGQKPVSGGTLRGCCGGGWGMRVRQLFYFIFYCKTDADVVPYHQVTCAIAHTIETSRFDTVILMCCVRCW